VKVKMTLLLTDATGSSLRTFQTFPEDMPRLLCTELQKTAMPGTTQDLMKNTIVTLDLLSELSRYEIQGQFCTGSWIE
jgi:hypothetical protein